MKISERFNLNKTQYELDFIDIDTDYDNPLFLDPYFLAQRNDLWSINATRSVRSFFQHIVRLIFNGHTNEARDVFGHLSEPNETCLGLSQGNPQGRGVGRTDANKIFNSILQSQAVQTGILEDLEDCRILVDNVDKDKISDMTTNIIRKHLVDYTKQQCNLWQIPLQNNVPTGFFWNRNETEWQNIYDEMLIINYRKILLVPKSIVSYKLEYTPQKYYQHFVLNFLQHDHLRMNSIWVKRRVRRDGTIDAYVTKKDLEENVAPYSKEFLRNFTQNHPEVFENFKTETAAKIKSIQNEQLGAIGLPRIIDHLIQQLSEIPSGRSHATQYHRLIVGILELLLYPNLTCPQVEREIHQGRKRIDITFDNAANGGFFNRLHTTYQTPAQFIFVECKNYSSDPENPELDQLAGRFSINKGKFGFIVCREINDMELFIRRCTDTYEDNRGVIIPLVDDNLISLLTELRNQNYEAVEDFLSYRFRAVALN